MGKLTLARDAERLLQGWEEFDIGSLHASVTRNRGTLGTLGDLPEPEREKIRAAADRAGETGERLYVIRHFETPIAWQIGQEREVYMPRYRYSLSTTSMQTMVARAYGMNWASWETERAVPPNVYADRQGGSWQAQKWG